MKNVMMMCLLVMGACQGPAGKMGAMGNTGLQGDPGAQGLMGLMGDKGSQGVPGTNGANGADGKALEIIESFHCGASLDSTGLSSTSISFNYDADLFDNGVIFATGTIKGVGIGSSSAQLWAPTQNGYTTASAGTITFDVYTPADAGWWTIDLDRSTLTVNIVYHDIDMTPPTLTWLLVGTSAKCVHNFY